jgi:hypothetical protein
MKIKKTDVVTISGLENYFKDDITYGELVSIHESISQYIHEVEAINIDNLSNISH